MSTLTYSAARALHDKARDKYAGKPLANNTRLVQRGDNYAVKLHATDVVTIRPDSTYVLNTGGWYTVTTKDRINDFGPARVYSANGVWCVWADDDPKTPVKISKCRQCKGTGEVTRHGWTDRGQYEIKDGGHWVWVANDPPVVHPDEQVPCYGCNGSKVRDYGSKGNPVRFYDGIVVDSSGHCTDPDARRLHEVSESDAESARVLKAIKAYVAGLTDAEIKRQWEYATTTGTSGDCLFCNGNVPWSDHLLSHIGLGEDGPDEIYHMASLTMNAIKDRGYLYPEVIFAHGGDSVRRAVSRYLKRRLITDRETR